MHLSSVHKPGEGVQVVKFLYREQEGGFKLYFLSLVTFESDSGLLTPCSSSLLCFYQILLSLKKEVKKELTLPFQPFHLAHLP